ncbi:YvcK family protein [Candidatus Woesebacteria bacterium]|nr:YvcK family protein [Candidatus Woesebacteria bacterium]
MKRVVVIGGGTGTFIVLSGLKMFPYDISAIVSTVDSGGSTGKLRDQYGALPPGDMRQCLVALSEAPDLWRKLFLYRFENGDFKGHNFGNIFLTVLEKIAPDYSQVIDMASYILQTKGHVIPVTYHKVHLCAQYEDGEIIETEDLIDSAFHKTQRIEKVYLKPRAKANPEALKAVKNAEYIIVGPGDVYTSLVPNLIVDGMKEAIEKSSAKIIYISNLMTKPGQTPKYTVMDHINDIEKYLGKKVSILLVNNAPIQKSVVQYYKKYGAQSVKDDALDNQYTVVRQDLLVPGIVHQSESDEVLRSILRHDPLKIAHILHDIIGTV